jgi:hypothetical protein
MSPKGVKSVSDGEESLNKLTPTELAKHVKQTLLKPPNKSIIFGSFARELGNDFEYFVSNCQNHIKDMKKLRLENLEKSIILQQQEAEKLRAELSE